MTKLFNTEIVTGTCPTCDQKTLLVGIANSYYRCSACGVDLEQKVNGVIKYIIADKNTEITLQTDIAENNGEEI
jgi:tRNA(Ile2) C34 agmatinyltransferase TiaS|tara:strand:- start:42 stop:263 length:222 start_codon:yes stop_codon:yes gene_type:complete